MKATSIDQEMQTQIDQMSLWHKKFADGLKIVVMVKTHLTTNQTAHVVRCSRDWELGDEPRIDYDRLRFQLAFNFRDANPSWGLEDVMRVQERPVSNRANRAMFMVNLSHAWIRPMRDQGAAFSVTDLKAGFRGRQDATALLKWLPESPGAMLMDQVVAHMAELGRVHHATSPS